MTAWDLIQVYQGRKPIKFSTKNGWELRWMKDKQVWLAMLDTSSHYRKFHKYFTNEEVEQAEVLRILPGSSNTMQTISVKLNLSSER